MTAVASPSAVRIPGKYERLCWERQERDLRLAYGDRWNDESVYGDASLSQHPKGFYFDPAAGDRVVTFVEGYCTHFEGDWAGKPLTLDDWQRRITRVVFGWKRADGKRRFRTAYIEIARKNGKSTWAGGIGLYLTLADGEAGAQIYVTATKKEQAKIVWGAAAKMVQRSRRLLRFLKPWKTAITCERTSAMMAPLGANSETQDGLNAHAQLVDEMHAHKDRHVYDVVATSMGARSQPLNWIITTAGIYDPESIGWEFHERATNILDGVFEDDTFFAFIAAADAERSCIGAEAVSAIAALCSCEACSDLAIPDEEAPAEDWAKALDAMRDVHAINCEMRSRSEVSDDGSLLVHADDWTDPATWAKANPNLGVSVRIGYMEEQCDRAKTTPSFLNTFKRYHLNLWTQQRDVWIPIERWNACKRVVDDAALLGRACCAGLDLSSTRDLTALVLAFADGDYLDFLYWFFCPEETIQKRSKDDRVPYDAWVRDGWMIATPGNVVDYAFIRAKILEVVGLYNVTEVAYDKWNAQETAQILQDNHGVTMVEFGQGYGAPRKWDFSPGWKRAPDRRRIRAPRSRIRRRGCTTRSVRRRTSPGSRSTK
jgi:phage terminase large subunit-like protein